MSFLGIGVCTGMVASLSLLNAWTIRHPPVAFFMQNVGLEWGTDSHGRGRLAGDLRRNRRSLRLDHGEAATAASRSTSHLARGQSRAELHDLVEGRLEPCPERRR
ncbi:hypothetical protein PR002_g17762 [Phytophthora rubi]|uniref:Uncharacterized protein n=1 Tax=Phytophthora rubi TaxID=129364 RepID=A0A6A3KDK9_9STRA|nr:hypothetical protein PR002_g17762 [Phytophthora rubi]